MPVRSVRSVLKQQGWVLNNKEREMTDHTPFFHLIGRDVSALLAIAEYLDIAGRDRIANLVRSVTMNIELTVSDLSHDLLRGNRRVQARETAPRKRKRAIDTRHDRSPPASSAKKAPEARPALRLRPPRPDS